MKNHDRLDTEGAWHKEEDQSEKCYSDKIKWSKCNLEILQILIQVLINLNESEISYRIIVFLKTIH